MHLLASQLAELELEPEVEGDRFFESFEDEGLAPNEFAAVGPNVALRALEAGFVPLRVLVQDDDFFLDALLALRAAAPEIPMRTVAPERLAAILSLNARRGMITIFRRKPITAPDEILGRSSRILVVERTVYPGTQGLLSRSAVALGLDAIVLGGGCEDPLSRRELRTGMGNIFKIPWCSMVEEGSELVDALKANGYTLVRPMQSLGEGVQSIDALDELGDRRAALVVDAETYGLPAERQGRADYLVSVPTRSSRGLSLGAVSTLVMRKLGRIG